MPFYEYQCSCGWIGEDFAPTVGDRSNTIRCGACGKRAKFVISATRTDFKYTDKEVRIPSEPKSVYIRRDK